MQGYIVPTPMSGLSLSQVNTGSLLAFLNVITRIRQRTYPQQLRQKCPCGFYLGVSLEYSDITSIDLDSFLTFLDINPQAHGAIVCSISPGEYSGIVIYIFPKEGID